MYIYIYDISYILYVLYILYMIYYIILTLSRAKSTRSRGPIFFRGPGTADRTGPEEPAAGLALAASVSPLSA